MWPTASSLWMAASSRRRARPPNSSAPRRTSGCARSWGRFARHDLTLDPFSSHERGNYAPTLPRLSGSGFPPWVGEGLGEGSLPYHVRQVAVAHVDELSRRTP